ncbi:hypothetical protein FOJ82_11125 [Tessaracoccus rhinocerotis]|uniref:Uncharacterized protein n=1 Tax=Tessaracoccus rhinocerotis TaxID=1689449 RepID=A0A553JZC9_9ACTN|nr:hypothetical protein [Tessaracoccus rhinocerotis]TRY17812.1 hypothetical protein FOJ82_11125 [Tessaracoccus rhinocerotis]
MDLRYCGGIPDDAYSGGRGERFITPSRNIACLMKEASVTCEAIETAMIPDFQDPEGDGQCNGFRLDNAASVLCHSEPILWDGWDHDPGEWPEMPYGDTVFGYEHVCEVEQSGVSCWNFETGHGFFLSRARYAHW